ncbi:hypothetical protein C6H68_25440 [Photorhabdus luminescens]|nr:hypothetical protein C6H68_25440 [Photorhabdus luminescens]
MAKIELICGKAEDYSVSADIILTDPPFDMEGKKLRTIIDNQQCNHLILITTMRQLLGFMADPGWELSFDFVLDAVAPKKITQHFATQLHPSNRRILVSNW